MAGTFNTMRRFAETCESVAATTKKTEKIRIVSDYLRVLPLDDAARAAVFLTGRAFPRRGEEVLGIGGSNLAKLVTTLSRGNAEELWQVYRHHGDLGGAAEELLRRSHKGGEVGLGEVAAVFQRLPDLRAHAQKLALVKELFEKASAGEVKYLIKIITGDLRIGLKESLVEEAIAKAFDGSIEDVRRANMLTGDIGETARLAATHELNSARLRLFHPIGFMLATPVETADELFKNYSGTLCIEEKYDGIRAQAHKSGKRVKIFSRTLDEVTEFPEVMESLARVPGEFVLDGEILAWQGSQPLPFTELQKRLGRKQLDFWMRQDVPVGFVAFDVLYHNGELLLDTPLADRRRRLETLVSGQPTSEFRIAPQTPCDSAACVQLAFRATLEAGHEGIVAKLPQSPYTPGKRGRLWLKLKEALATLDVVVTAVEYGHGKRHGVLSDYTFAVRDGSQFLNIGKAYSGLTDAEINEYTQHFLQHTIEDQGFRRIVEPQTVIEVAFNNIQRSSRHASGYALRFPRIVRLRPDKPVQEIDTLARVAELYARQTTLPRPASDIRV
jgi:ATP-dependent DNA ligase